jgi:hypothetical protein
MIRFRFRFRVDRLAREYHNHNHNLSSASQRFDILYFGRDEFSCQVFEKLYSATGRVNSLVACHAPQIAERAVWTADVWHNLLIATQPDQMVGRKRDVLSVCQSSASSPRPVSYSSTLLAPLKALGNKLGVPVTTIPPIRSELKTWKAGHIHPFKQQIPLTPPSLRDLSIPWLAHRPPVTSFSLHLSGASFRPAFYRFLDRRTPSTYTHPLYQPTAAPRPSSGPS